MRPTTTTTFRTTLHHKRKGRQLISEGGKFEVGNSLITINDKGIVFA